MARRIAFAAAALLVICSGGFAGAELYVVCNSGTSLAAEDVFDVFLGGKQFSGGTKLVPVDNAAAQEEFLAKALRMTGAKYSVLWTKKSFRDGIRPPPVKGSDAETLEFVRKTPGGVGYVRTAPSGVKVISKY
jgi:hypothetical protein